MDRKPCDYAQLFFNDYTLGLYYTSTHTPPTSTKSRLEAKNNSEVPTQTTLKAVPKLIGAVSSYLCLYYCGKITIKQEDFDKKKRGMILKIQQGLEIRWFWFQKKTVQLKTALRKVYAYVLKGIFFRKTVYLQGFLPKSAYLKVTVM